MAKKQLPDEEELFAVEQPDVEGADDGWDDEWDELEPDVPAQEEALGAIAEKQEDVAEIEPEETSEPVAAQGAETVAEAAQSAEQDIQLVEASTAVYEVQELQPDAEDEAESWDDDWAEGVDEDIEEAEAQDEDASQDEAPQSVQAQEEEIEQEQAAQEDVSAEDVEEPAEEAPQKTEEELRREQEELEAYRESMGESNAELADISEYRTFRKKTKTQSTSAKPKKSDFDLFANRYKVKTMNAMVAASDPIVYFYNACLRKDGSVMAFNVYQVLQDRFVGKMIPQLYTAVAENSSKIEELNEANLLEQIKVCAEFPQYEFIMSMSARFFVKPALLERLLKLLPEEGVPNLVMAFDCASLENIAIAAKAGLSTVRQRGVKVLLDNTEKVTMTVLSEFDYDYIRIDSRYYEMGNPRAEAYLRLLLSLTKEEGISSIATFCDSEDLADYMFFMGVDAVQGNATSRPMRTVPNAVRGITLLPSMLEA